MKKLLVMFCIAISLLFAINMESKAQSALTVQGGYSWLNGVIGLEFQVGKFAISGGYFPTKMPGSGDRVNSFSGAITWYGEDCETSSWYLSTGIASAGYRSESSYNGGSWEDGTVDPMTIFMIGYKGVSGNWTSKLGAGVGFHDDLRVFTWEFTVGYAIGN